MSRGYGDTSIKSESLYETGNRQAMARLAKRVGMDLRKTATTVANEAGFRTLTSAADDWKQDPKYSRTLFRDFLNEKIAQRIGAGSTIPNSLTIENFGQEDEKSKVSSVPAKDRLQYEAAEGGSSKKVEFVNRQYVGQNGKSFGEERIPKSMDKKLKELGAKNLLDAVINDFGNRNVTKSEDDIAKLIEKLTK